MVDWTLVLMTSNGNVTIQLTGPASPPASKTGYDFRASHLDFSDPGFKGVSSGGEGCEKHMRTASYTPKYAP